MATFKIKHEKTKHLIQINTLDETHKKIMASFQSRRNTLPKKKKKLELLQNQLNKIEKTDASYYTTDDIKKRSELRTEINNLVNDIYDIENDLSEIDYYARTEDIIMDYYEITDNDDDHLYNENPELSEAKSDKKNLDKPDQLDILNFMNKTKRKPKKITKRRKKKISSSKQVNILDFFNGNINQNIITTETEEFTDMTETELDYDNDCNYDSIINSQNSSKEINNNENDGIKIKNKAELLDQYMMLIDSEYMCEKKRTGAKIRRCPNCNLEKTLIHAEGIYVCQNCGEVEPVIIDSEKPNYKEASTDTKPGYPYKRIEMVCSEKHPTKYIEGSVFCKIVEILGIVILFTSRC